MATRAPNTLRDFVKMHREVEAVIQHVGRQTWDVLLVDVEGAWVRDEVESLDAAEAVCVDLGIRWRQGWDPRLARRMASRDNWIDPRGQRRAL